MELPRAATEVMTCIQATTEHHGKEFVHYLICGKNGGLRIAFKESTVHKKGSVKNTLSLNNPVTRK